MTPTSPGRRAAAALLAGVLLCGLVGGLGADVSVAAAPSAQHSVTSAAAEPETTVSLKVRGCEGCTIQPVQSRGGAVLYLGPTATVTGGRISWRVPTSRTRSLAFQVTAPFDELAQGGIPAVVLTGFRGKQPGSRISDAYAKGRRTASGCWSGTTRSAVSNTVIVKRRTQNGQTSAAAWLRHTWKSGPFWWSLPGADFHVSDPTICR